MANEKYTKKIFCANEQKETIHELTVSSFNGEIIATCDCGSFLKFPSNIDRTEFAKLITAQRVDNEGQVSIEAAHKKLRDLADLAD